DDEFPVRAMSLRVLAAAVDTATHAGATLVGVDAADDHAPADLRFLTAPLAGASMLRTLVDHWSPSSVRFRAALRAAIGLALAVLIAKAFDLDHAFWVVLGTLSVLRSNALGTGVTGVQAVLGTAIGFAVATLVILVVGGDHNALWVVLPIAVFASAYTPGAIHFVVGQASFTVFVVVLFNLLEPEGWKTGLVRVEDIAIGVGISLVVGVLLWPRGARAAASGCFKVMLTDGTRLVTTALDRLVGDERLGSDEGRSGDEVANARIRAVASRDRAIAALEDLTVERGGGRVDREWWIALLTVSGSLLLAGDGIERLAADGRFAGCADARAELEQAGHDVDVAIRRVVDRLGSSPDQRDAPHAATFTPPATDGLCACVRERAANDVEPPIALLWTREFLTVVQERLATLPA
ncbi:MAG TPA: FUSC family protein, partial [Acidimicrobiia bacterium]|nr:FUSC family protein [Acidimicrobiia bacterium]